MVDLQEQAEQFYSLPDLAHLPRERVRQVLAEIERTGSYTHTAEELEIGAKLAWRNHDRCLGRGSWRALSVLDARGATTAAEVAEACFRHLRLSTNGGSVKPMITVFAPQRPGEDGIRIWNPQLVRYAGYEVGGEVIGDPLHVGLTDLARGLGWKPKGGRFDVLPLVIQLPGQKPEWFDLPADTVLEVPITHPDLPWFEELGLRWHANPAVSNLAMEIGGLSYTAAPFSGWYVSSEIGARNFADVDRYDMLPAVAERMGLDTSTDRTLWRDRALVELNVAVLHSFGEAQVHITDHHAMARNFVAHVERESRAGRATPANWAWVNPPLSASTTPTFHREFDPPDPDLRPNFVHQPGFETAGGCPFSGAGR